MFDTVAFILHAPLRSGVPKPWCNGVRFKLGSLGSDIARVEASLPKLLWGHNGRLITSQAQLKRGLTKLWETVNALALVPPLSEWKLQRADLVWHFDGLGAERIVDALSAFRFPSVSSPPMHQAGRSVTWRGARSRFMLVCYCKSRKAHVAGDVLRIEVRLVGRELVRLHGADWWDFGGLWRAYRRIVMHLPPLPQSAKGKAGWPEAAAQIVPVEKHGLLLSLVGLKERQLRTVRQTMSATAANLPQPLRWESLLPSNCPSTPPCVEPRRKRPPSTATTVWTQGVENSVQPSANREGGGAGVEKAAVPAPAIGGRGAWVPEPRNRSHPLALDAMHAHPTCASVPPPKQNLPHQP